MRRRRAELWKGGYGGTLLLVLLCVSAVWGQGTNANDPIRVIRSKISPEIRAYRAGLKEEVPAVRSFRAPILANADQKWDPKFAADLTPELKISADIIGRRLAMDGLGATLGQVLEVLGTQRVIDEHGHILDLLASLGYPVDLLRCFSLGNAEIGEPYGRVIDVTRSLARGATPVDLAEEMQQWEFRWPSAGPGFQVALDSGEEEIGAIRLQIAGDKYYKGPGDGGTIDFTHQLLDALPDVDFVASIEEKHVEGFLALARTWNLNRPNRLTLFVEPLPVSQWAQDNAKAGIITAEDGTRTAAIIVPRYASRWEEWSCFVPGESFLVDSLAADGKASKMAVIQSALLFQGGNLLAVRDPKTNKRLLLISESDVYRNVALGLTNEQVLTAFRTEFGVDECVVLPSISYHLDYEVSLRSSPSGMVAFVNDEMSASRRVIAAGLDVMAEKGLINAAMLSRCRESLRGEQPEVALAVCEEILSSKSVGYGQFPLAFSDLFAVGSADSGVGNLQRFLLAIDVAAFSPANVTWKAPEAHGEAYARSLRRRAEDRRQLSSQLEKMGWSVVAIPSTSDGRRSLNYLNGVHVKNRYLMPSYAGLFAGMDQGAVEAFRRAFWMAGLRAEGPPAASAPSSGDVLKSSVEILPIRCGESQRRYGALRCSVNVLPRTSIP